MCKEILEHSFKKFTGESIPIHEEYYSGLVSDREAKFILGELLYALNLFKEDEDEDEC